MSRRVLVLVMVAVAVPYCALALGLWLSRETKPQVATLGVVIGRIQLLRLGLAPDSYCMNDRDSRGRRLHAIVRTTGDRPIVFKPGRCPSTRKMP